MLQTAIDDDIYAVVGCRTALQSQYRVNIVDFEVLYVGERQIVDKYENWILFEESINANYRLFKRTS